MSKWLFLLFLVACGNVSCPEGYVASSANGSSACISALSYCVQDDQCTSAQFDCKRPCAHLPVNILFSSKAQEKSQACDRSQFRCKQVPFVDNSCFSNQCFSIPHTAEELIPQPKYQEVVAGKTVCYERSGFNSVLRLSVLNNASIPLTQLEAYVNVSLINGSLSLVQVDLLNESLSAGNAVEIRRRINNAVPNNILIFVVRPVKGRGVEFGVKNNDVVFGSDVPLCDNKPFKA